MRKHPVILGLLLLLFVGVIFFLVVYFLGSLTGKRSLSLGDHVGVVTVEGCPSGFAGYRATGGGI